MTNVPLAKQVTALSKALSHIQLYQSEGFFSIWSTRMSMEEQLI